MRLKLVGPVMAALLMALVAEPASAQFSGADGYAFVKAVRERDGNKVTELLQSRPNIINSRDDKGETALMVAVSARDHDFTSFLLSRGADPTLAARNGDTALIKAARIGFLEAAQWVLKQRVPVDAANKMGETALIIAVQQRHPELVELLLSLGANPDKTDSAAGLSAREYAKRDGRSREILAMMESAKKTAPTNKLSLPQDAGDFKIKN